MTELAQYGALYWECAFEEGDKIALIICHSIKIIQDAEQIC